MKKIFTIFITCVLLLVHQALLAQSTKSYFDAGLHAGGNLGTQLQTRILKLNAYNGAIFGGFAGWNKKRLALRFQMDYAPSNINYKLVHPNHPEWQIEAKQKVNLLNYGLQVGVKLINKPKTQATIFFGFNVLHEIVPKQDQLKQQYFVKFYDEDIQRDNQRLVLAAIPFWGDKSMFAPSLGFEYKTIIANIPFYVQLQTLGLNNPFYS